MFSKIFSDKNTNTKPCQTHHSNNKIFQHFNPNVITKWFIVVRDDHRCWWLGDFFAPDRIKENKSKKIFLNVRLIMFRNNQYFTKQKRLQKVLKDVKENFKIFSKTSILLYIIVAIFESPLFYFLTSETILPEPQSRCL